MASSKDGPSIARIVAVCLVVAMLPGSTPVAAVDVGAGYGTGGIDDGTAGSDGGIGATLDGDASDRLVALFDQNPLVPLFHQVDDDDEEEEEDDEEDDEDDDDEEEEEEDDDDDEEEEEDDEEDDDDDGGLLGLFDDGDDRGPGDDEGDGDEGDPDRGNDEGDRGQEGGPDDEAEEDAPGEDDQARGNVGNVDAADAPVDAGQAETPTRTPTVTTEAPVQEGFRVENVTVNRSTVAPGEPFRVTATVVNGWSTAETRDVHLVMFDESVAVRAVTVPSGGAEEVTFVRAIQAPGTYEVSVGQASTEVTVTAAEDGSTTRQNGLPEVSAVQTPGFTALAALLGVLGAVLVARRIGRD